MKKIYIEDSREAAPPLQTLNLVALRARLLEMSIMAEIEEKPNHKVVIRVGDAIGTNQYFASAHEDFAWLKQKATKIERRGNFTLYFMTLDG